MARRTIGAELDVAQRMIGVAQTDAEVGAALAQVGYDAAMLAQGAQLLAAAQAARTRKHSEHGDRLRATTERNALQATVRGNVGAASQIARALFPDAETLATLGLARDRRERRAATASGAEKPARPLPDQSLAALLDRARLLYGAISADPALAAAFASVGHTAERLAAERALVAQLEAATAVQARQRAEARQAVVEQGVALEALQAWISRMRIIARVTLRDRPDLQAKLGL